MNGTDIGSDGNGDSNGYGRQSQLTRARELRTWHTVTSGENPYKDPVWQSRCADRLEVRGRRLLTTCTAPPQFYCRLQACDWGSTAVLDHVLASPPPQDRLSSMFQPCCRCLHQPSCSTSSRSKLASTFLRIVRV